MSGSLRSLLACTLLVACASTPFSPSSIGLRFEPGEGEHGRYLQRDSRVAFEMPAHADGGEREEDDAGFERVVVTAHVADVLYRVVVFRPIDGTEVAPASAITRLADGLIADQAPSRDEPTMVQSHAARRITLPRATSDGRPGAFLVTADDRALVLMERLGGGDDADALADAFFATLELGCDR